jgi:hypothetical protein
MLWKTHIRISNESLRRSNIYLSNDVYSRFKEGVIAPDKWGDYPHHYGKGNAIQNNLLKARQYYLIDNHNDSFFYLGVALHYIQDAYTSVVAYRSKRNREWHHNYEQRIEDSQFVKDIQASIAHYCRDNRLQLSKYSTIANRLNDKITGKNDTISIATIVGKQRCQQTGNSLVDLNLALKACQVITQSVLSPKSSPQLDMELTQALHSYQSLLKQAEKKISDQIIESAINVDRLVCSKKNDKRMVTRIKNGLLSIRAWLNEWKLTHKYNDYVNMKHLLMVHSKYQQRANEITTPHINWFIFIVPPLELNLVKNELIPIGKVAKESSLNQKDAGELIQSGRLRSYGVGKQRIVLRKDLIEFDVRLKEKMEIANSNFTI